MWTTDTFSLNLINILCLKWTKTGQTLGRFQQNVLIMDYGQISLILVDKGQK